MKKQLLPSEPAEAQRVCLWSCWCKYFATPTLATNRASPSSANLSMFALWIIKPSEMSCFLNRKSPFLQIFFPFFGSYNPDDHQRGNGGIKAEDGRKRKGRLRLVFSESEKIEDRCSLPCIPPFRGRRNRLLLYHLSILQDPPPPSSSTATTRTSSGTPHLPPNPSCDCSP